MKRPKDDGRTHSPESLLEQLRANNGASEARVWMDHRTDRWVAFMAWGNADEIVGRGCPLTARGVTYLDAEAGDALAAVDLLAAKIPAHREHLRSALPGYIKELRELAKII